MGGRLSSPFEFALFRANNLMPPRREVLIASGVNTRRGDNACCGEAGGGGMKRSSEGEEMMLEEEEEEDECIVALLLSRDLFMVSLEGKSSGRNNTAPDITSVLFRLSYSPVGLPPRLIFPGGRASS